MNLGNLDDLNLNNLEGDVSLSNRKFGFLKLNPKSKNQARIFFAIILVLGFVALAGVDTFTQNPNIVEFVPNKCSGDWQNPEMVNGPAILYSQNAGTLLCNKWNGNIPEGANIVGASLKLSLHIADQVKEDPSILETLNVSEVLAPALDSEKAEVPSLGSVLETATINLENANTINSETQISPETQPVVTEQPTDVGVPVVTEPAPVVNPETPEATSQNQLAETPTLDTVAEDVPTVDPTQPVVDEVVPPVVETVTPVVDEKNNIDASLNIPLIEIQYKTKDIDWTSIATVTKANWQDLELKIPITNWKEIDSLEIRVVGDANPQSNQVISIDSIFLNIEKEDLSPKVLIKDPTVIVDAESDFKSFESPTFTITDPNLSISDLKVLVVERRAQVLEDKASIITDNPDPNIIPEDQNKNPIQKAVEELITFLIATPAYAQSESGSVSNTGSISNIQTTVLDYVGNPTDLNASVERVVANGIEKFSLKIDKPEREFKPGQYTLVVDIQTDSAVLESRYNFSWGVLAINMNKSFYAVGDNAYIQMGVLDDQGSTICDAELSLTITDPEGVDSKFSSANNSIQQSGECGPNNVVEVPDYFANFADTNKVGKYILKLSAVTKNGEHNVIDEFVVSENMNFDVERISTTRTYTPATYQMKINIISKDDFTGIITEKVPKSFIVSEADGLLKYSSVDTIGDANIIKWNIPLKAGKKTTIGYNYKGPNISPEFFLLGPLEISQNGGAIFTENRAWQIASDLACASPATGTSDWNTIGTWSCGRVPTSADAVTITAGGTVTLSAATAVVTSLTVNGTLNTHSAGGDFNLNTATLTIGATGTLTANSSTITLSATTGVPFTLTAGGTFTAGTSTVVINGNAALTLTNNASITFSTLTLAAGLTTSNRTYTFGNTSIGNTITIGTFNVNPTDTDATANNTLTVNGANSGGVGGPIVVTGTTTVTKTAGTATPISNLSTNATSSIAFSTGLLVVDSSCIFTANASTVTLTGTSGTLFTNNGTFTSGTSTIKANPDASVTILSAGTFGFNILELSPSISTSDRTYTLGGTTTTFKGNVTINPTGTKNLTVNLSSNLTFSATSGATLTIGRGATGTATSVLDTVSSTITTSGGNASYGIVIGAGGTLNANSSSITIQTISGGTIFTNNGTFNQGTSTITLTGAVASTLNSGSTTTTFYNLTSSSSGTITLGAGMTIASGGTLTIGSSGTFDPLTYTITGTSATLTQTGTGSVVRVGASTFAGNYNFTTVTAPSGNNTIDYHANAAQTVENSLITTYQNLTFSCTTTCTGSKTLSSGTTTVSSSRLLTVSAGATLDTGNNTLTTGRIQIDNGATLIAGSSTITINGTIAPAFTLTSGGTFTANTSTVSFTATNTASTSGAITFYDLKVGLASPTFGTEAIIVSHNFTINPTTNTSTVNMGAAITVAGDTLITKTASGGASTFITNNFAFSTGTLTIATACAFTAGSSTVTLSGTTGPLIAITGTGVYTAGTSTVDVTGNGSLTFNTTSPTFYNLTFSGTGTKTIGAGITLATGGTLAVNAGTFDPSTFAVTGSGTNTVSVASGATLRIGASTFTGSYVTGFTTRTISSGGAVEYSRAGDQTIDSTLSYSNLSTSGSGTKSLDGTTAVGIVLTIGSGTTLSAGSNTITLSGTTGTPFVNSGSFSAGTGTVSYTGANAGGDTTVTTVTYYDLIINASDTFNLAGATTVTHDLTITTGTLDAVSGQNYELDVGRNWSNSGTFTARSGLVKLNTASTATVGGSSTTSFYDLTITHTAAKEVDFAVRSGNPLTITHTFTVTGSSGNLIKLYSTVGATKWYVKPTGTASVAYADVKDGGCDAGAITMSPTNTTDSGNNDSCWGLYVPPTLSFSLSDSSVGFGALSSSIAKYATGDLSGSSSETEAHNFVVSTNAGIGYIVTVLGSTLTSGSNTIAAIGNSNVASIPSSPQFGLRITATGGLGTVTSPYDGSGFAYNGVSAPSQVCSATSGNGVSTTYSVRYISNISSTTPAGQYLTNLTYIVTGTF